MEIETLVHKTAFKKKSGTYTYGTIHISTPELVELIGKKVKIKIELVK